MLPVTPSPKTTSAAGVGVELIRQRVGARDHRARVDVARAAAVEPDLGVEAVRAAPRDDALGVVVCERVHQAEIDCRHVGDLTGRRDDRRDHHVCDVVRIGNAAEQDAGNGGRKRAAIRPSIFHVKLRFEFPRCTCESGAFLAAVTSHRFAGQRICVARWAGAVIVFEIRLRSPRVLALSVEWFALFWLAERYQRGAPRVGHEHFWYLPAHARIYRKHRARTNACGRS